MIKQKVLNDLIFIERDKLFEISTDVHMELPKEGFEEEHAMRTERVEVLDQLIKETLKSFVNLRFDETRESVIMTGEIIGLPEVSWNIANLEENHLYIYMKLLEKDETGEDTRFVRISNNLRENYFNSGQYDIERISRLKELKSVIMRVYMNEGTVFQLEWKDWEE